MDTIDMFLFYDSLTLVISKNAYEEWWLNISWIEKDDRRNMSLICNCIMTVESTYPRTGCDDRQLICLE